MGWRCNGLALVAIVAAASTTGACRRRSEKASGTSAPSTTIGAPAPEPPLPKLEATSGGIAVDNLNAQIDSLEKRSADRVVRASLVDMLLSRGQFLGRITDYERAETLAQGMVDEAKDEPGSFLARAATRATFHAFGKALDDLVEAERLGAKPDQLVPARASILSAQGKLDEALALRPVDETSTVVTDLATTGLLLGDLGKTTDAERWLGLARERYRDVSPFPLAWMDAKQGALYERLGRLGRAKAHYARAVSLLPRYATAAAHLAALSTAAEAIALLEPLVATSDDPEVLVQLADALRRAGRSDEAKQRLDAAIARYDELVKAHPEAFADHAASMWLGPGRDPVKALSLAQLNLDNRKTAEAYQLVLESASAAKMEKTVCARASEALALPHAPDSLRALARSIVERCS
jgi:tetratricopeptide (TPR) repeat protein